MTALTHLWKDQTSGFTLIQKTVIGTIVSIILLVALFALFLVYTEFTK